MGEVDMRRVGVGSWALAVTLAACDGRVVPENDNVTSRDPFDAGAPGQPVCPDLDLAFGTAGDSTEAFCDLATPNPPECPTEKPEIGTPCAGRSVRCAYNRTEAGFSVIACLTGAFLSLGNSRCARSCDARLPSEVPLPIRATCGSRPPIPCDALSRTRADLVDARLLRVLQCCGAAARMAVRFQDGCAVAYSLESPDDALVDCVARVLAGRRVQCAESVSCARAEAW